MKSQKQCPALSAVIPSFLSASIACTTLYVSSAYAQYENSGYGGELEPEVQQPMPEEVSEPDTCEGGVPEYWLKSEPVYDPNLKMHGTRTYECVRGSDGKLRLGKLVTELNDTTDSGVVDGEVTYHDGNEFITDKKPGQKIIKTERRKIINYDPWDDSVIGFSMKGTVIKTVTVGIAQHQRTFICNLTQEETRPSTYARYIKNLVSRGYSGDPTRQDLVTLAWNNTVNEYGNTKDVMRFGQITKSPATGKQYWEENASRTEPSNGSEASGITYDYKWSSQQGYYSGYYKSPNNTPMTYQNPYFGSAVSSDLEKEYKEVNDYCPLPEEESSIQI